MEPLRIVLVKQYVGTAIEKEAVIVKFSADNTYVLVEYLDGSLSNVRTSFVRFKDSILDQNRKN